MCQTPGSTLSESLSAKGRFSGKRRVPASANPALDRSHLDASRPWLTTNPPSPTLARMRHTFSPSRRSHCRRLAPQVQRPRLRPSWRIALAVVAAAATLTLVGKASRAIGEAIADRDWPEIRRDADRLISEQRLKEERAQPTYLDPEACKLDYGVDVAVCDETMYRQLGEERAAKARADEEAGRAVESRPSARPAYGTSSLAPSPSRR